MSDRVVLGFAGYVESGKSSLSKFYVQNHGFKKLSFATKIKEIMVVLGVPMEVLQDPVLKEKPHPALCGATPRDFMEGIGKLARDLTQDKLWVQQFLIQTEGKPLIVIDDVRHQNEVDTIAAMGGHVYRLRVPNTQPRVPTDFCVDELTGVEDLTNDIGTTLLKHLYQFTYGRTFGQIPMEQSYEDWFASR
jgi:hypothetical protein